MKTASLETLEAIPIHHVDLSQELLIVDQRQLARCQMIPPLQSRCPMSENALHQKTPSCTPMQLELEHPPLQSTTAY